MIIITLPKFSSIILLFQLFLIFIYQNWMDKLKKVIRKLDFFYVQPKLNINRDKNHQTLLGSFLTISIFILLIAISYIFGKEIIERKYPVIVRTTKQVETASYFKMSAQNYPLLIKISRAGEQIALADGIFDLKFGIFVSQRVSKNGKLQMEYNFEQVDSQTCQIGRHIQMPQMDKILQSLNVSEARCFPFEKLSSLEVGGNFYIGESSSIHILIRQCTTDPDNPNQKCKSDEEIHQALKYGQIQVFYPDFSIDASSQQPIQSFGKTLLNAFSIDFPRIAFVQFNNVFVNVDSGYIFEDFKNYQKVNIFQYTQSVTTLQNPGEFLRLVLSMESVQDYYEIKYQKIQQAIAEIGGFFKVILVVLILLSDPFLQTDYYAQIMNKLSQSISKPQKKITQLKSGIFNNFVADSFSKDFEQAIIKNRIVNDEPVVQELQTRQMVINSSIETQQQEPMVDTQSFQQNQSMNNHIQKNVDELVQKSFFKQIEKNFQDFQMLDKLENTLISVQDEILITLGIQSANYYEEQQQIIETSLDIFNLIKMTREHQLIKKLILNEEQKSFIESFGNNLRIKIDDIDDIVDCFQMIKSKQIKQNHSLPLS